MKIARFGLLCCLLTSLAFSADTQTNSNSSKPLDSNQTDNRSTKPIKPTEIKTEAKESISRIPSPYEIASLISENPLTDLKGIWLQLGIKTLNFGSGSNSEGGPIESFLNKCNNCDVDTYSCDLDGEPGKDVLLKVSDPLAESWRYLVFRQIKIRGSKPEWKLLGHIDHGFGRYRMPEHSIFYGSGRNFLVIKVQEGSGSGFAAYYDRLFQVETTGLKEIMSFPSEGHLSTCCYHPTREFSTQIRKCEVKNGVVTVELEFSVSYSDGYGGLLLWKKTQKAIYTREMSSNSLVLDRAKSDVSEEEIAAIYAGEGGLSDENVIRYNNDELTKLASGKEDSRKEWLRLFLEQDEPTPEKQRLRRLIDQ